MTLGDYRRDGDDAFTRTNASLHKSRIYQISAAVSVSFTTGKFNVGDNGTRTAKGALAMTNVSNILLFDEEDLLREATALLLGNRGASVTKSATIDEMLRQLERRTYDVVVVDIPENHAEPGQFLELLLAKTSASTRVVVCTNKPLPPKASTGISRVLVKPYPFDDLIQAIFAVRGALRQRSRHTANMVTRRITTPRRSPVLMKRGRA